MFLLELATIYSILHYIYVWLHRLAYITLAHVSTGILVWHCPISLELIQEKEKKSEEENEEGEEENKSWEEMGTKWVKPYQTVVKQIRTWA